MPVNEFRCHISIAESSVCTRCEHSMETIIHMLRDCPLLVRFGSVLFHLLVGCGFLILGINHGFVATL